MKSKLPLVLTLLFTLLSFGQTVYVDTDAIGADTGQDWTNAYAKLQSAIDAAVLDNSITEIWVAEGIYYPSAHPRNITGSPALTNRDFTFHLIDNVKVYGGFDATETLLSERDVVANPTILSGDIGIASDASDNSFHVVLAINTSTNTILDGFTIQNGNANDTLDTTITVDGVDILQSNGGGIYNHTSALALTNLNVIANSAYSGGGGIINYSSSPTISNSSITQNSVDPVNGNGGGILNTVNASPILEQVSCNFNTVNGMFCFSNSSANINNSNFNNNIGAGAIYSDPSTAVITNSFFNNNDSHALRAPGSVTITNCSFIGNSFISLVLSGGTPMVSNCSFKDNTSNQGSAALYIITGTDVSITDCEFKNNSATGGGGPGVLTAGNSNVSILNSVFEGNNSASPATFGVMTLSNCTTSIKNVIFSNNSGTAMGCIDNTNNSILNLTQCLFVGNSVTDPNAGGGGLVNRENANATVTNCTFFNNTAGGGSSILNLSSAGLTTIYNSVFYGNNDTSGGLWGGDIANVSSNPITGSNNYREDDPILTPGFTQLATNPFFNTGNIHGIDGILRTSDDGLVPTPNVSVLINAGDNTLNSEALDIAGETRVNNGIIDVGAYEGLITSNITIPNNDSVGANNDDVLVLESSNINEIFTIFAPQLVINLQIEATTITEAQLLAASTTPIAITGTYGVLTINNYNDASGLVSYNYNPTGTAQDHSLATNDILGESFALVLTDNFNATIGSETLNIGITDASPAAVADSITIDDTITENIDSTGNVILGTNGASADTCGTDIACSIQGVALGDVGNVELTTNTGTFITGGTYLEPRINADGSVGCRIFPAVQAILASGDQVQEIVSYTLVDGDGDFSTTTLTITINGTDTQTLAVNTISVPLDNGSGTITPNDIYAGNTADTPLLNFSLSQDTFTCADVLLSPINVTLTVSDNAGHSTSAIAQVTVTDDLPTLTAITSPNTAADLEAGDTVSITAMFSEAVTLENATGFSDATIPLDIDILGGGIFNLNAVFDGLGNGTNTWTFIATIPDPAIASLNDTDGITYTGGTPTINLIAGASIQDVCANEITTLNTSDTLTPLQTVNNTALVNTFNGNGNWTDVANWDFYPGTTVYPGYTVIINGTATIPDALTITNSGTFTINSAATLIISGTLNNTNGTLTNSGTIEVLNTGLLGNIGMLTNLNSGIIAINDIAQLDNNGTVTNSGTINTVDEFSSVVNSSMITNNGALNNNGAFYNSGTLDNPGTINNTGVLEDFDTLNNTGTLSGTNVSHTGDFTNIGILSPGNSSGTYTFDDGNYTHQNTASLQIELESTTAFDDVLIGNTANLDGTLEVTLLNGFAPNVGDTFTILSANAVTGTFATTILPADYNWNVIYTATEVTLELLCSTSRLYVNTNSTGNNDGTDWANAYTDLQSAIDFANNCNSVTEIWVAQGSYFPSALAIDDISNGSTTSRDFTFYFNTGLSIYGGFNGTEISLEERNPSLNVTILSGDIGVQGDTTDNCYHVFSSSGIGFEKVIDGVTIQDGYANGSTASPQSYGGGLYMNDTPYNLKDVIVKDNYARAGGGIYYFGFPVTPPLFYYINNTSFINNTAQNNGGAISMEMAQPNNKIVVTNGIFSNNSALSAGNLGFGGGAIYKNDTDFTAINSIFDNNTNYSVYNNSGSPTFLNCSFTNHPNGGLHSANSTTYIYNTVFNNNQPGPPGATTDITGLVVGSNNFTKKSPLSYGNPTGFTQLMIGVSPFVDIDNADGLDAIFGTIDDGLILNSSSELIDMGLDNIPYASLPIPEATIPLDDIAKQVRFLGGAFDVGAYELQSKLVVAPKAFLQGALLGNLNGLMRDDLRSNALIPINSPYTDGLTCNANVFNTGGVSGTGLPADDIVDWIWVELRDNTDNTLILEGTSALLQRDGDIVSIDGLTAISYLIPFDDFYVAIKHRSHLGVITATAVALTSTNSPIDFTNTSAAITFGTHAQSIMTMLNVFALWAGNANADTDVRYQGASNDTNSIKDDVLAEPGNSGASNLFSYQLYNAVDVNMDGTIRYQGASNDSNSIKDIILSHPDNTGASNLFAIQEQLPEN